MTHAEFLEQALVAKKFATDAKALRALADRLKTHHYANDFGTAGDDPIPAWLNEDANGNIDGTDFTRAEYMAMFDMAFALDGFFNQGHGDNVEKVADA